MLWQVIMSGHWWKMISPKKTTAARIEIIVDMPMKEAVRLTPIVAIAKFERIYPITLHPNPWYRMVMANFGLLQGSVKSSFKLPARKLWLSAKSPNVRQPLANIK